MAIVLIFFCADPTQQELNETLLEASNHGNLENVADAVMKGADIDFIGKDEFTALQYAAMNGYYPIVQHLVESGANLDIPAKRLQSMTPLHLSALRGFFEITIYLIENGADITARDDSGRTPLHTVAMAIYDGKI